MKTSIIIVDDHKLIADALAIMINRMEHFEVMEVFDNGNHLKTYLDKEAKQPDIVILDVNMPIVSGVEMADWVSQNYPAIKILALSMQDDELDILNMIQAGANGYLLKSIQPVDLENALDTLVKQGFYYTNMVTKILANNARNKNTKVEVTEKEKLLLQQLCTDLSYKEIANVMALSTRTIETYANNLMEKFEVRGRIGLVLFAQKNRLV